MAVKSLYELVGVDNITPASLNQALKAGWSNKPLTAPEIHCPGKAPFIGQCQSSMYLAQAKDGGLGLARPAAQTVDLTKFSAIVSQ